MKGMLRFGLILVAATMVGPAWGQVTVIDDFDGDLGAIAPNPDVAENTISTSTDTPTGGAGDSTQSAMIVIEDWNAFDEVTATFAEAWVEFTFDTPIDHTDAAFINFYLKGEVPREGTGENDGAFVTFIEENDSTLFVAEAEIGLPTGEWEYRSIPLDFENANAFTFGAADGNGITKIQIGFGIELDCADTETGSTMNLWLDHLTMSETEPEGELTGATAPGGAVTLVPGIDTSCAGGEGEGEGEAETIRLLQDPFPILGQPYQIRVDLPFTPDFATTFWSKPGEFLNDLGAPCIEITITNDVAPAGASDGDTVEVTLRHPVTNDILPVDDIFWTNAAFDDFGGPDSGFMVDGMGIATFDLNQSLFDDFGFIVAGEGELFHYFPRLDVADIAGGGNCPAPSKAINLEFDPENLTLDFSPLEMSDAGEYCVFVGGEVDGEEFGEFLCVELFAGNFLAPGTMLPVAGIAGLALLGTAVLGGGVYMVRRRKG